MKKRAQIVLWRFLEMANVKVETNTAKSGTKSGIPIQRLLWKVGASGLRLRTRETTTSGVKDKRIKGM